MLQPYSRVTIADNSGAKVVRIIQAGKNVARRRITIGSFFSASVKEASQVGSVKRKQVVRCLLVRQRKAFRRKDGTWIRFDDNAAVVINENREPLATRIFGPIPRELRQASSKLVSMAPEVV